MQFVAAVYDRRGLGVECMIVNKVELGDEYHHEHELHPKHPENDHLGLVEQLSGFGFLGAIRSRPEPSLEVFQHDYPKGEDNGETKAEANFSDWHYELL